MNAYIVVVEHPYYALTKADGSFVLENVPPGQHKLRMWHEGVAVAKIEMENGKPKSYSYEPPYEEEEEVMVSANGYVTVDFPLILRATSSDITTGSASSTRQ